MNDARFEDGGEEPLHLKAMEADDLPVISALVQDSIFPVTEMRWQSKQRRFAILLNRFRWEDIGAARPDHTPERVQSVLVLDDVQKVQSQGINLGDKDLILSLLSVTFEAGKDGTGQLLLTLAGDGAISAYVEALDVTLKDVTRPYIAPSKAVPQHPE